LGGRCSQCKVKIDKEYLWTEIFAGFLAILTYVYLLKDYFNIDSFNYNLITGLSFAIFYTFLFVLFLVIALYDLRHKIVPLLFSVWIIIIGIAMEVYRIVIAGGFVNNLQNNVF
jgi:hypothetical protein